MIPTIQQLTVYLLEEDEVTILELLDISTSDLIEAFKFKIRERKAFLNKYYEESNEEDQTFYQKSDSSRLASKEVWENAGFDLENDAY